MMNRAFSFARICAILLKEFLQMRRDRVTLGMIVGIPLMQLFLFGFAINSIPRPAHRDLHRRSRRVRPLHRRGAAQFQLFRHRRRDQLARRSAPAAAAKARCCSWSRFRSNFTRDMVRGAQPDLLIEADATDPAAGSYALAAFNELATTALRDDLKGPLAARAQGPPPFNVVIASALQSGIHHPVQHRARTCWRSS